MKKLLVLLAFCLLGSNVFAGPIEDLMNAAKSGNTSEVERLISSKEVESVDVRDAFGNTAIMYAASYGQTETVAKLAELGADINAKDKFGITPRTLAEIYGHDGTADKLKELGAVEAAQKGGHIEALKSFVQKNGRLPSRELTEWDVILGEHKKSAEMNVKSAWPKKQILMKDARADLLNYISADAGISDNEIAERSLSKIQDGLSKDPKSLEYVFAISKIAKEGNLEFLESIQLDRSVTAVNQYLEVIKLLKELMSIERERVRSPYKELRTQVDILTAKDNKVEEIRTNISRLKTLK